MLHKPEEKPTDVNSKGLFSHFISTFFLTVTNPTTILLFIAIFAGMGIGAINREYSASYILVLGVFIGSAVWWLILSTTVSLFKSRITINRLRWINVGSGLLMIVLGLYAFYSCMSHG